MDSGLIAAGIGGAGALMSVAYLYGTLQLKAEFRLLSQKINTLMVDLKRHDEQIAELYDRKVDRRDCVKLRGNDE